MGMRVLVHVRVRVRVRVSVIVCLLLATALVGHHTGCTRSQQARKNTQNKT